MRLRPWWLYCFALSACAQPTSLLVEIEGPSSVHQVDVHVTASGIDLEKHVDSTSLPARLVVLLPDAALDVVVHVAALDDLGAPLLGMTTLHSQIGEQVAGMLQLGMSSGDLGIDLAAVDAARADAATADAATEAGAATDLSLSDGAIFDAAPSDPAAPDLSHSDGTSNPYNYVFVTSTTVIPGKLASMNGAGPLAAADQICATAANGVGLPGTYRAWLSTSTVAAISRLTGARGWVRVDGKPVLDLAQAPIQLWYPILTESGQASDVAVATATLSNGTLANDCNEFTSTGAQAALTVGTSQLTVNWTLRGSAIGLCSQPSALYCFGVDRNVPLSLTPTPGRRAFITRGTFIQSSGFSAAQTLCSTEASKAGLTGTFTPLLATSSVAPASRFNTANATWVRTDGVPLLAQASDLNKSPLRFLTSLDRDAMGNAQSLGVITGALSNDATLTGSSTSTCSDWSIASGGGSYSYGWADSPLWSATAVNCGAGEPIYCFEQ